MAKTRRSCFVYAILAIAHLCNCEAILSQKEQDKVSQLPGQNFNVNFAHYSGFVTTNEKMGRALFYWLFEAAEDPASKPLVLWLNGGNRNLPKTFSCSLNMFRALCAIVI